MIIQGRLSDSIMLRGDLSETRKHLYNLLLGWLFRTSYKSEILLDIMEKHKICFAWVVMCSIKNKQTKVLLIPSMVLKRTYVPQRADCSFCDCWKLKSITQPGLGSVIRQLPGKFSLMPKFSKPTLLQSNGPLKKGIS